MNFIISLFVMSLAYTFTLSAISSQYPTFVSQSLKPYFEDIQPPEKYLKDLENKLHLTSFEKPELTLIAEDFHLFQDNYAKKDLLRFYKNQRQLFQQIEKKIKMRKKSSLSQLIKDWMSFSLTSHEKLSLDYISSLTDKSSTSHTEKRLQNLLQSSEEVSLNAYQEKGFSVAEALYARHMNLYEKMLSSLKENFDPETYFHIESCKKAEEKILIQAYLDDIFCRFSQGKIMAHNNYEESIRDLLTIFFLKRERLNA